jgi:O-antigen ligase/tetratricopeptide (TPR) repeat protein
MRSRDQLGSIGIAIAIVFTALAFGGATRWATVVGGLLCIATAVFHATSRRRASSFGPLVALIVVAIALTTIQLVPLNDSIAEILAPERMHLTEDNARALGDSPPAWTFASYDPPATLVELARLCGYAALAWIAVRLAAQRRGGNLLAQIVVATAVLVVVVASVHHVIGTRALYGTYRAPTGSQIVSPIINDNHFAALCALAVPLALGLALTETGNRRRLFVIAGLALVAATLLSGSRGGVAGLAVTVVVAITLLAVQRRSGDRSERPMLRVVAVSVVVVAACSLVLLGIVAGEDTSRELSETRLGELHSDRSKFEVWRRSTALIEDNRWLGVGRGGFELAYHRVAPVGDVTFSHAENTYLQTVLDWGIPGACAIFVALLGVARELARRCRSGPLEATAFAALAGLAVHELFDFSLALPVVAMAAIAIAAILTPARLGTDTADTTKRWVAVRAGLLALAALVMIVAATPLARSATDDRSRIAGSDSLDAARRAFARHPSDALAAGELAQALFVKRDERAVAVVQRALHLRPSHPGLHRLAGRMLAVSQRPEQALIEMSLALRWADDPTADGIISDVLAMKLPPERAARAFPAEIRQLWRIHTLLDRRGEHALALAFVSRVAERHPDDAGAQLHLAKAAAAAGQPTLAVTAGRAAMKLRPSPEAALVLARAAAATGDRANAIAVLRDAPPSADREIRMQTFLELGAQLRWSGDLPAARAALLDGAAALSSDPRREAFLRRALGDVEEQLGNLHQARWERQRAVELDGAAAPTQ